MLLHADSEVSDQTGRMPRLIRAFTGHTCHFVGFVMRQLISVTLYLHTGRMIMKGSRQNLPPVTCAPSKDSAQPGHLCTLWVAKDP